jgi:hypothetical protein
MYSAEVGKSYTYLPDTALGRSRTGILAGAVDV